MKKFVNLHEQNLFKNKTLIQILLMFHVFQAIFEQENLLSKFKFYLKVFKLIFLDISQKF
jgi:hypothetical protein